MNSGQNYTWKSNVLPRTRAIAHFSVHLTAFLCCLTTPGQLLAQDDEMASGITEPKEFAPFNASAPTCIPPPHRQRVLAFAQDNERQFMQGVSRGLSLAAKDRGLSYRVALADNDANRMIAQVSAFADENVGAVVVAPVDAPSVSPNLKRLIRDGSYVGAVVPPPAITLLNAPQYLTGRVLGDAAAAYIKSQLKGKANVVLLTHDSLQFLSPRFAAMRDALKDMPDVEIVADISPLTVDEGGGFCNYADDTTCSSKR